MKQLIRLTVLLAVAGMLVGSAAQAAKPKAGAIYAGNSDDGDSITIYAKSKTKLSDIVITDGCEEQWQFEDVKVNDKGKFKAVDKGDVDFPIFTIKGKFVKDGKVKGKITSVSCSGSEREYTLERVT